MTVWKRLRGWFAGGAAAQAAAPLAAGGGPEVDSAPLPARPLGEMFFVMEMGDAEPLAGNLFRRRFATDSFPATPKHFVAFYREHSGAVLPLGYVHFEIWEGQALGGGLVIDERLYRRVPAEDRVLIRAQGGVAEWLLRESIAQLPGDLIGVWGYVGDRQAEKVDLRAGFRHTELPHVMVIWRRDLTEEEKASWVRRVGEYGLF